jgi:uncharacterized protein (TIGR02266 family)
MVEGASGRAPSADTPGAAATTLRRAEVDVPKNPMEARVFTRADAELEVRVSLDSEHNFIMGRSENISEGGLFIATNEVRPLGSTAVIEVWLPGETKPVTATGEVRWVRPGGALAAGIGFRFIELADDDVAAIRRFVEEREPMFWE